jgi:geranylgeranyl pyrophosphate synthase
MLETSELASNRIRKILKPLEKDEPSLYRICFELLEKRLGNFLLRGYLARFSYQAVGSSGDWKNIIDFVAAVELEIAAMYYSNRIFDQKGGKEILSDPNKSFMAAVILRDMASLSLTSIPSVPCNDHLNIKNIFDEIDRVFYVGEYRDMYINVYSETLEIDETKMLDLYIQRCYEIDGHYFEKIAEISSVLANAKIEETAALKQFGKDFGIALQIINDIADFIPPEEGLGTSSKIPDDAYSDIKMGKLTAPLIFTLCNGSESEKETVTHALKGKSTSKEQLVEITKMLVNNGSITYAQRLARKYANSAKKALSIFSLETRRPLALMCVLIDSNRYIKAMRKYKTA